MPGVDDGDGCGAVDRGWVVAGISVAEAADPAEVAVASCSLPSVQAARETANTAAAAMVMTW
jgi:hypothetical protein